MHPFSLPLFRFEVLPCHLNSRVSEIVGCYNFLPEHKGFDGVELSLFDLFYPSIIGQPARKAAHIDWRGGKRLDTHFRVHFQSATLLEDGYPYNPPPLFFSFK